MRIANHHTFETTEKHEPDQLATTYEAKSVEVCPSGAKVGYLNVKWASDFEIVWV